MSRNYSSVASSKTLASSIAAIDTQISLNNLTGLPTPPYTLVINPDTTIEEIVTVNSIASGTTLNVSRGQEGTTAQSATSGNTVRHMITGRDLQDAQDHIAATTAVHGLASGVSVVGSSTTQTLTNKTIALGSNTVSGTKAQFNASMTDDDFATISGTETLTNKTLTSPTITSATHTGTNTFTGTVTLPADTVTSSNIVNDTIVDADINSAAAIAWSKMAADTNYAYTNPVGMLAPYAGSTAPSGWLLCDGSSRATTGTYAALFAVIGYTYGGSGANFNIPDLRGRTIVGVDNMGGTAANVAQKSLSVTTNGTTTVTTASTASIAVGQYIIGSGIPAGATVTAIASAGTSFTISAAATASATITARFSAISDAQSLGKSGGADTHTLSAAELPSHTHTWTYWDAASNTGDTGHSGLRWDNSADTEESPVNVTTNAPGNGIQDDAHNNMQPSYTMNYIIKY